MTSPHPRRPLPPQTPEQGALRSWRSDHRLPAHGASAVTSPDAFYADAHVSQYHNSARSGAGGNDRGDRGRRPAVCAQGERSSKDLAAHRGGVRTRRRRDRAPDRGFAPATSASATATASGPAGSPDLIAADRRSPLTGVSSRRRSGLPIGSEHNRLQRLDRRPVEDGPVGGEARAVAWAVPTLFSCVPTDDASEMGTRCIEQVGVRPPDRGERPPSVHRPCPPPTNRARSHRVREDVNRRSGRRRIGRPPRR